VAVCRWPGANAQQVEQLVTRPIEQAIAQNKTAHPPAADTFGLRSISLPGASFVYVNLSENTKDSREQFSDINLRLAALSGRLPQGASPIVLQSDFGDTAAMMITVATPPVDSVEIDLRARSVEKAIRSTPALMKPLQTALSREIPGALVTVHQLQTNPVEFPVEVRIFGLADVDPQDEEAGNRTMLRLAGQVEDLLRPIPGIAVVHNDWFSEGPEVKLKIDPDRANLAGITNLDVAASAATAISGQTVTVLREGNLQIPVIARLREQERAQLSDIEDLYVYSTRGQQKVPIRSVSSIQNSMAAWLSRLSSLLSSCRYFTAFSFSI
jgi:multidrug efflux pump subunit AcrB